MFSLLGNTRELGFLVELVKAKKIGDACPVVKLFMNAVFEARNLYGGNRSKNDGNTCQKAWLLKSNG
jgi:hypothetical protein